MAESNINYQGAGPSAPRNNFAPDGFLGGMLYYDEMQNYRQQQEHRRLLQQQQQQDYLANAPLREANRGLGVATAQNQTRVQPSLATSQIATNNATTQTAPSDANARVWKNEQVKKAHAEELVSNYLRAILEQQKANPSGINAQQIWSQRIVPQLEQQLGEKIPDQFRAMDVQQMQMVSQALLQNTDTRRHLLQQGQKNDAHMARTTADNTSREKIAGMRGDNTSAAEVKREVFNSVVKSIIVNKLNANPKADKTTVVNEARIEAANLFYGGNPVTRAEEARRNAEAASRNKLTTFEKFTADGTPWPKDASKRADGKVYKHPTGSYYRWVQGKGWLEVTP